MTEEQVDQQLGASTRNSHMKHEPFLKRKTYEESGLRVVFVRGRAINLRTEREDLILPDGLHVGSTRAEVEALYGPSPEGWARSDRKEPGTLIASRFVMEKGLMFKFDEDVVRQIVLVAPQVKTIEAPAPEVGSSLQDVIRTHGLPHSAMAGSFNYLCRFVSFDEGGNVTYVGVPPATKEWCSFSPSPPVE